MMISDETRLISSLLQQYAHHHIKLLTAETQFSVTFGPSRKTQVQARFNHHLAEMCSRSRDSDEADSNRCRQIG